MTFAQWAKNNTKINDGKDFDEAYLLGIFERIVKTPLKLNEAIVSEDGPRKVRLGLGFLGIIQPDF